MTENAFKESQLLIITLTRNYIHLLIILLSACTSSECFRYSLLKVLLNNRYTAISQQQGGLQQYKPVKTVFKNSQLVEGAEPLSNTSYQTPLSYLPSAFLHCFLLFKPHSNQLSGA